MNANVVALLVFFGILIVGFVHLVIGIYKLNAKYELITEFTKRFINLSNIYFDKGDVSSENYEWLLANVDEVNNMLGAAGTISYKPAFANYIQNNYQVLINTIPHFKTRAGVEPDEVSFIEALLKRFASVLNKSIKDERRDVKNPFKWFLEGVSVLLSVPLNILKSLGVLSSGAYGKVTKSGLFKAIVSIIALISFVDTLYTIFSGSSFTVQIIYSIVSKL